MLLVLVLLPGLVVASQQPKVLALRLPRVDRTNFYSEEEGLVSLEAGAEADLEVLGLGLEEGVLLKFTTAAMGEGADCGQTNGSQPVLHSTTLGVGTGGRVQLQGAEIPWNPVQDTYYVCLQVDGRFVHQGMEPAVTLQLRPTPLLPLWVSFIFLAFLLALSGLFSGLNLGLMSLDQTELQIVIKTGTESEQEYAKAIAPVRNYGNFLLCSLLLGNVLVNVIIPMLLDSIPGANGILAVLFSTMGIVVFGEIIPQAVCSRYGLLVGAYTIILTKFFMLLTFPLSWPISKLLDCLLGKELGTVYDRARLLELLRVTHGDTDLNKDEVNILQGALVLQEKKIEDIMTPLGDCYMLPLQAVLDFETISEIKHKGYSRIPVYDDEESSVVHILLAKDLLFVDPDDKKPLAQLCNIYKTPFIQAEKDRKLDKMLNEFKTGEKGHLAMVMGEEDQGAIGVVTLEDIIEEIIQTEIVDETDIVFDNRTKKKRRKTHNRLLKEKEVQMFLEPENTKVEVSSQVSHAVFQFLSSSIAPFGPDHVSKEILNKLLLLDVFRASKQNPDPKAPIITQGVLCDFFILIIEGRVEVQIGKEGYIFESGPFTSFGKQVLVGPEENTSPRPVVWTPDVTLVPKGEVLYLKVRQGTYRAAVLASCTGGEAGVGEVERHLQTMVKAQNSMEISDSMTPLLSESTTQHTEDTDLL